MSYSEMMLCSEIIGITILGFWATNLRKKNKAKFLKLKLHQVKDLREKDVHLNAINNMLKLEEHDPEYMAEAQILMLKKLGVDIEAMQLEAKKIKEEEDAYDNDPNISEEERLARRRARLEEREQRLRDRERREIESRNSNSSSSSSSSSSDSDSDSSSGGGGGFDGGGASASW